MVVFTVSAYPRIWVLIVPDNPVDPVAVLNCSSNSLIRASNTATGLNESLVGA